MPPFSVSDRPSAAEHVIDAAPNRRLARAGEQLGRAATTLEAYPALAGLLRFGLVGASGVLVNLVVLAAALRFGGRPAGDGWHAAAETVATQVAVLWNFALTEAWVFPARTASGAPRWLRFGGYWLVSMLALGVQLPLTAVVVRILPVGYLVGTGLALLMLVVGRYLVCRSVMYRGSWTRTSEAWIPFFSRPGAEGER